MEIAELKQNVDRLAALTIQQEKVKAEIDQLKAGFEKQAEADLKDSKEKTIEYWGEGNAKVVVQNSETVKPIAMSVLRNLLGTAYSDFVKEESKATLNAECKSFLTAMVQGKYIEDDLTAVIGKITSDAKEQQLLLKKLKGKYRSDKKTIMKLTGLDPESANDYAYLVEEVYAYKTIKQILEAAKFAGTFEDAVEKVKASVIVDEGIKVTVEKE